MVGRGPRDASFYVKGWEGGWEDQYDPSDTMTTLAPFDKPGFIGVDPESPPEFQAFKQRLLPDRLRLTAGCRTWLPNLSISRPIHPLQIAQPLNFCIL